MTRTDYIDRVVQRAHFSSGIRASEFLDRVNRAIDDLIAGKVDPASTRLELKRRLEDFGYRPDEGKESA